MAKCLVIGGNGFLGSHVVDELVASGHDVTAFDRFSSAATFTSAGVRRVAGDYLDSAALRAALEGQELLFHLLSTTTPVTADADPTLDIRTNVAQGVELLTLAVATGVQRVYFASTGGAIYGDQALDAIPETALPVPISPYAIGKLALEGYLRYFERKHGLRSVTFRISNPYGPRQHPEKKQGVIPIFLQHMANGEPIEIFGDDSMVRDYLFAPDMARMIVAAVGTEPAHDIYNIGSGHGASLGTVIELARAITGSNVDVVTRPRPATFVQRSVLDISRYSGEFGAPDLVSLEEGMARTWAAMTETTT